MNYKRMWRRYKFWLGRKAWTILERLESVQGPEQGLVGESRSGSSTGPAEEAKPGERGVGKIVELAKLLRHIDYKIKEERLEASSAASGAHPQDFDYYEGKKAALVELREWLSDTAEKRSDLPNGEALPPVTPERNDDD